MKKDEDSKNSPEIVPKDKSTDSLIIRELVRPYVWKDLEEFISKNGKIIKYWLHPLKTHCYVQVLFPL